MSGGTYKIDPNYRKHSLNLMTQDTRNGLKGGARKAFDEIEKSAKKTNNKRAIGYLKRISQFLI